MTKDHRMSFIDRIAAAVTPMASAESRAEARQKAEQLSQGNDWLGQILQHHRQLESAFDRAINADDAQARISAGKEVASLLMAHANAEEAVIYPAVVEYSGKAHATMAYEEQAAAKINLAILENMDPMSKDWTEKLEHIQGAVQQHVYQEESSWFPDVAQNAPQEKQTQLTKRYEEEFGRYNLGGGSTGSGNQPSHLSEIA
jgi:hemerythrin superfamily protein